MANERWQVLRDLLLQLGRLRRRDHQAARLQIERERWGRETEHYYESERRRVNEESKSRRCAAIWAIQQVKIFSDYFGGGEVGREMAAHLIEIEHDLPEGCLSKALQSTPQPSAANTPDQTRSSQIKPNQTDQAHSGG